MPPIIPNMHLSTKATKEAQISGALKYCLDGLLLLVSEAASDAAY